MEIHIHHYHHDNNSGTAAALEGIERQLSTINRRLTDMTKSEAARLDTLTNAIKARFDALLAKIPTPLTPEEQAQVDADLNTLEQLGKDPNEPIPTA